MVKEMFKIPPSVEELERKKIVFDEETICALGRAFDKNPGAARELEEIVGQEKVRLSKEILVNTGSGGITMKYEPEQGFKTVYGQIAKRELERIEEESEDDENLNCGHTIEDHIYALQDVVEKMSQTVN